MSLFLITIKKQIKYLARKLAWKQLTKAQRKRIIKLAKEKINKRMRKLAFKCVREANEKISDNYVSEVDSSICLDPNND